MFQWKRKHSHTASYYSCLLVRCFNNVAWSAVNSWAIVRVALLQERTYFHFEAFCYFGQNKMLPFVSHWCTVHFQPEIIIISYDLRDRSNDGQYISSSILYELNENKWVGTHVSTYIAYRNMPICVVHLCHIYAVSSVCLMSQRDVTHSNTQLDSNIEYFSKNYTLWKRRHN